jgi:hypothetical protein
MFQHCFAILYPKYCIPTDIANKVLNIQILQRGDLPLYLSDIIAASFVPDLIKQNFFSQGKLVNWDHHPMTRLIPKYIYPKIH